MDHLTPDRLIVVGLFLAVLIGLWAVVQRNRTGLARRISGGRRLRVIEVLALGADGRATLIEAEGRMILVLGHRRGAGQMLDLGPAAPTDGGAA